MNRKTILLLAATITLLIGWRLTRAVYAVSTTVTVDRTSDASDRNPGDGICDISVNAGEQCSLRAAIEELNALGPDTTPHRIEFNITGTGPFTITPNSPLPAITVPVVIDGETQPGASCPTNSDPANLLIVLDGSNAGTVGTVYGLTFNAGSEGSTVRGLVIGNFNTAGIVLSSDGNIVRCNHLGIGADGLSRMGNRYNGVIVSGADNTIGGQIGPAQRNVISANNNAGININPTGSNNRIRGNFIGTTADGLGALGNGGGVYTAGDNNIIGGTDPQAGNVISGNGFLGNFYGISVNNGQGNSLRGNYIGVAKDGATPLPNLGNGVVLTGDAVANVVGGTAVGEANIIAFNGFNGVLVNTSIVGTPSQNTIRGNIIYDNGNLGIDLGDDGVDTNDPGDGDGGENEHQNYPVLLTSPGSPIVDVSLDSKPNTVYQIDTYLNDSCDPSGFGQGQEYFQTFPLQTDSQGQLQFQFSLSGVTGRYFTATATDPAGNTSEFSACALLEAAPTPTETATAMSSPTSTSINTPTATTTSTPTITGSPTVGPSPTTTNTPPPANTPTPTGSATPTAAFSPTATATTSPTSTATSSPSPTPTLPPGVTPTATAITSPTPDPTQDDSYFIYLPIIIR